MLPVQQKHCHPEALAVQTAARTQGNHLVLDYLVMETTLSFDDIKCLMILLYNWHGKTRKRKTIPILYISTSC